MQFKRLMLYMKKKLRIKLFYKLLTVKENM